MKFSFGKLIGLIFTCLALLGGFVIFKKYQPGELPKTPIFHQSYFTQKDFYEQAYQDAKPADKQALGQYPKAILVNHHLLAGSFIAESFNYAATSAPITVLLISPNHFDAGTAGVLASAAVWKTPYGNLPPDKELISKLSKSGLAKVEEDPFEQEHGVSGIVAFIKKSLPNAKIVPLIFKNFVTLNQAEKSADEIYKLLPSSALVVGSFDFSHYLPSRAADFHDLKNLATVQNFNLNDIEKLDIDSRPGLAFFLKLLENGGDGNFHVLEHSNSAKLTRQDVLETTSYITGYYTAGNFSTSSVSTLLSFGTVDASEEVASYMQKNSPKFALNFLERLFYGQDLTSTFLHGNNELVKALLNKFGIQTAEGIVYNQLGKIKAAILDCPKVSLEQPEKEIDQGADVVVCQGAAKNSINFYKAKPIVYASGSFLDKWSLMGGTTSLAVGLAYDEESLQIFLLPIGPKNGEMKLLIGAENDRVLMDLANNSPSGLRRQILQGVVTIKF